MRAQPHRALKSRIGWNVRRKVLERVLALEERSNKKCSRSDSSGHSAIRMHMQLNVN